MKLFKVLLVFLTLQIGQFIIAQDVSSYEDEILNEIQSSFIPSLIDNENNFCGKREGMRGNSAEIKQLGNNNITSVNQNGTLNHVIVTRSGNGNVDNVSQNGNNHEYNSIVRGNFNANNVDQRGSSNVINQNLLGDNQSFTFDQRGHNLEINQVESDLQARGYEVRQRGNGMKVTISNGVALP
jgi:hypothetical protein